MVDANFETSNPSVEEISGEKVFRLGSELPTQYSEPLSKIKSSTPEVFAEQAERAASIFYVLDENLRLVDSSGHPLDSEVTELARNVSQLPSVNQVNIFNKLGAEKEKDISQHAGEHEKFRSFFERKNPEDLLPHWVVSRTQDMETRQELPNTVNFYNAWVKGRSTSSSERNGLYHHYYPEVSPDNGELLVDNFKCYLEHDISEDRLQKAFSQLEQLRLHPHSSKLSEENRVVLYWNTSINDDLQTKLLKFLMKTKFLIAVLVKTVLLLR